MSGEILYGTLSSVPFGFDGVGFDEISVLSERFQLGHRILHFVFVVFFRHGHVVDYPPKQTFR